MNMFQEALSVDDVLLETKISEVRTRNEVNLSQLIGFKNRDAPFNYHIPIFSAPMDSVTGVDLAISLLELGGMPVLPRFEDVNVTILKIREINRKLNNNSESDLWLSVGLLKTAKDMKGAELLIETRSPICVDVAHGGNSAVVDTIKKLKEMGAKGIMAGNVATVDEALALADAGVDIIRVGIGSGSCCTTRIKTGHGMPTFQSVYDIANRFQGVGPYILADGGIKNSGDMVKLLGAGAHFVMLGNLLAATHESSAPYKIGSWNNQSSTCVKVIRGMASAQAKHSAGIDSTRYIEGESGEVVVKGFVEDVVRELLDGVRSGLAYSGAHDLPSFRKLATFRKITSNGLRESHSHGIK